VRWREKPKRKRDLYKSRRGKGGKKGSLIALPKRGEGKERWKASGWSGRKESRLILIYHRRGEKKSHLELDPPKPLMIGCRRKKKCRLILPI